MWSCAVLGVADWPEESVQTSCCWAGLGCLLQQHQHAMYVINCQWCIRSVCDGCILYSKQLGHSLSWEASHLGVCFLQSSRRAVVC
jgi:hypothetical protein